MKAILDLARAKGKGENINERNLVDVVKGEWRMVNGEKKILVHES